VPAVASAKASLSPWLRPVVNVTAGEKGMENHWHLKKDGKLDEYVKKHNLGVEENSSC